jgi:diguanylate cyclase (GGDEF)-like protein
MNLDPDDIQSQAARHRLAMLEAQADTVRAELARLRRDLAQVERDFSGQRAAQLLEANEQLVLAALQAESVAETATSSLDQLSRSIQRDVLTGMPNRALMRDRLEGAFTLAKRRATRVAVVFIDLDGFKQVNDTLGHAVGDEALQAVGHRLESVVRESDTVSRHGGDEFLVLLAEVGQRSDAALIADKMRAAVAAPLLVDGREIRLTASIGVAVYPEDGTDARTLIDRADAAMYRSKRGGPGGSALHARGGAAPEASDPARQAGAGHASPHADLARNLREANEQLVIAAVASQELQHEVEAVHSQQMKLLAVAAHELRNPLGPIRNAAEVLKHSRSEDALVSKMHGIIDRQVNHMSRLVEDLLDGARVSTGKFRIEHDSVNLSDVLGIALETCRAAIDAKGQQLRLSLPAEVVLVRGDAVRLTQIFSNLLDNASKYTHAGGVIAMKMAMRDRAVTVTVADNGIGITPSALPQVFDLFVQGTRALTAQNRGLGIGLAVVRELVEAHGGTVVATSAGKDRGSEFVVTLALAPPGQTA